VLAGDQPALAVAGIAVGVVRGPAEHAYAPTSRHCAVLLDCPVRGHPKKQSPYNPSTMNARDFVDLIRMAVISFVF
jgi:hypothetical protein